MDKFSLSLFLTINLWIVSFILLFVTVTVSETQFAALFISFDIHKFVGIFLILLVYTHQIQILLSMELEICKLRELVDENIYLRNILKVNNEQSIAIVQQSQLMDDLYKLMFYYDAQ